MRFNSIFMQINSQHVRLCAQRGSSDRLAGCRSQGELNRGAHGDRKAVICPLPFYCIFTAFP